LDLDPYSTAAINRYFLALAKYKSLSDATSFMESHAERMGKEGLNFTRDLLTYYRDCLTLPPSTERNPNGNFLFRSIYGEEMENNIGETPDESLL
jgi:hypothetical protein